MRKLKIGDVVYPTVPFKAYDGHAIIPAGTPVTVQNPSVPTTSHFFESGKHKNNRTYKHYVSPPDFVLVTFQLDGKPNRGAVYRDQLWLKPVPAIVTKRFPATRMGVDLAADFYRNVHSRSKHLNRLRASYIVKTVKPITEGEIVIANTPQEAENIAIPRNVLGRVIDRAPNAHVVEVEFPGYDLTVYVRYDQIKVVL